MMAQNGLLSQQQADNQLGQGSLANSCEFDPRTTEFGCRQEKALRGYISVPGCQDLIAGW